MTRGSYATRRKQLVEEALQAQASGTVSSDELWSVLMNRGEAIGKTTVYRQLEQMVADHRAQKTRSPSGMILYQYVENIQACDGHLHCQCQRCGQLFHVDCGLLSELTEHLQTAHGFTLDVRHTVLLGLCGMCRGEEHGAADT